MVAVVATLGPDPEPARWGWRRRGFGRSPKIGASSGKPAKIYENEIAFFCFLLLFGIELSQQVTPDSNKKKSLQVPSRPRACASPFRQFEMKHGFRFSARKFAIHKKFVINRNAAPLVEESSLLFNQVVDSRKTPAYIQPHG
jgi:hypothetical protein